ncbi:MAG: alkaline phosphatase family protein [Alphaproteobacteria bacterium]
MRRLLIVGLDGADIAGMQAWADAGEMPQLARMLENGVSGDLALVPPFQPLPVWAGIATGCRPRAHGVAGTREARADGGGVQPTGRASWRRPAFWEVFEAAGAPTVVVNWPATQPATDWPGTVIDPTYPAVTGPSFDDWPLPPDCVSPTTHRDALRNLRRHGSELGGGELLDFMPHLAELDQASDPRPQQLASAVAATANVHAVATALAESQDWQVLAVVHDLPRQLLAGGLAEPTATQTAHRLFDMMLARLLELAGPACDVVVLACPAAGTRGLFAAQGDGLAADRMVHGLSLFDVAPSLLALHELAFASLGDGSAVDALFDPPPAPARAVATTVPAPKACAFEADLTAIGYAAKETPAQAKALAEARVETLWQTAEADLALGDVDAARGALEEAWTLAPDDPRVPLLLARARALQGDWQANAALADALSARFPDAPWGPLVQGAALAAEGQAEAARSHLDKADTLGREDALAQFFLAKLALYLRQTGTAERHLRQALALRADLVEALVDLATVLIEGDHLDEAQQLLQRAIAARYFNAEAHLRLGQVQARRGFLVEAQRSLQTALRQKPDLSEAGAWLERTSLAIRAEAGREL